MTPDLLTLRVDFRDEQAAARITPQQANAYLAARGWRRGDLAPWHQHRREQYEIIAGLEQGNREAHQGIAKQKAANERLRAEVASLRGILADTLPDDAK